VKKKLIEVALPLDAINKASAREKSIRHGHPSTLHLWWARRPLAAARAVIFAQMVDDPSALPDLFPTEKKQEKERQRLFKIIEDLVLWENTTNEEVLERARVEIWQSWRRACAENVDHPRAKELFDRKKLPAFHDPFAGGGALPLEAQRLGLESFASDLNPVAVLINKAMIEIPPRFAAKPPVNPQARSEWRGVRSESDALSRDDSMAEGDGSGPRSVSARAAAAAGRNLRDALADHASGGFDSGEHRGGLDAGERQGQGPVPGHRSGLAGGGGDVADALRGPAMVSEIGDGTIAGSSGRSESHADHHASQTQDLLTSHFSLLFPRSYRGAQGLAEDVRYYGKWMRDEAEKRIGHLYPKIEVTAEMAKDRPDLKPLVGTKLMVIAWLWARTVKSPNPAFRELDVPLASTFTLSSRAGREAYVEPIVENGSYRFTVKVGKPKDAEAANGTRLARGANFRCLLSGTPITSEHIYAEARARRMGKRLMAIVADSERGRIYLPPTVEHEATASNARPEWRPEVEFFKQALGFRVGNYGMATWADLFTERQIVSLTTHADLVHDVHERVKRDGVSAGLSRRARLPTRMLSRCTLVSESARRLTTILSSARGVRAGIRPRTSSPSKRYRWCGTSRR
jgi:putative DNA methylase